MSVRFVLAPQAALDLVEIWRYIKEQTSLTIANRVESAIREKIAFLAGTPGAGHSRKDLTDDTGWVLIQQHNERCSLRQLF